jgi:hypothetical protein
MIYRRCFDVCTSRYSPRPTAANIHQRRRKAIHNMSPPRGVTGRQNMPPARSRHCSLRQTAPAARRTRWNFRPPSNCFGRRCTAPGGCKLSRCRYSFFLPRSFHFAISPSRLAAIQANIFRRWRGGIVPANRAASAIRTLAWEVQIQSHERKADHDLLHRS